MKAPIRTAMLIVALAGSLAACGQANEAIDVNGTSFSQTEVLATTEQLGPEVQNLTSAQVVQALASAPLLIDLGKQHGIVVTDEAARTAFPNIAEPNRGTLEISRSLIAGQHLQSKVPTAQAELQQMIQSADIEISPRYGHFDNKTGFGPAQENWIAPPPAGARDTPQ